MEKNLLTVNQTDERMFYLKKMLEKVRFSHPTHVFAPNIVIEARTLENVPDHATVFCGKCLDEAHALANSRDIGIFSFLTDEKFQAVNSRLTAEGALQVILEHSVKSIADCNTLILGFGRTGAAMARILNRMDASLDIATTSSLRPAHAFANKILSLRDFDFSPYDVVVNTVPAPIVKDAETMTMRIPSVYVDLASKPAVNLEYARYLGVDADIYPALPAKTCPFSAAKAMADFILEVIKCEK